MKSPPVIQLSYTPPYDWNIMLGFFGARAVAGVEEVTGVTYRRRIRCGEETGILEVTDDPANTCLHAGFQLPSGTVPPDGAARLRQMFDLATDTGPIFTHLAADPVLGPLVAARPGLRIPGGWDGIEVACRAVNGQQVSIAAARRLNGRLVARCHGLREPVETSLTHVFPEPAEVLKADLSNMGMPSSRVATLKAVAEEALQDETLFERTATVEATVDKLRSIRGIGEWSAHYIALRACREPDAFPASDAGLLRAATALFGVRLSPKELTQRAEAWRPRRAYAAQHLWLSGV
jgi:AraC family transcriptional regulator of adaptative response / DNA-3-methyladenine glycosylase II